MSIENVNQKILFQSLYKLLLHVSDVVLVLSDTAEKMIRELNRRNLDQGVLPTEMGQFTTEYSNNIGMEVDKDKFTPTCVATVPEKSHHSHSTGSHVSIAGGIKVKFTVDIIALKNHPTEITNALHHIVCTTCEEMTLVTVSKLMANQGHAQVGEKKNDMRMWRVNHYVRRDTCRNVMSAVLCNSIQVTCNILNVFIFHTFDITLIYFSSVQNMSIQKHFVFWCVYIFHVVLLFKWTHPHIN